MKRLQNNDGDAVMQDVDNAANEMRLQNEQMAAEIAKLKANLAQAQLENKKAAAIVNSQKVPNQTAP